MSVIYLLFWIILIIFSLINNKDIFSPAKIYLLNSILFFSNIGTGDYDPEIHYIYLIYLLIGLVMLALETSGKRDIYNIAAAPKNNINDIFYWRSVTVLWLLTTVPIAVQVYLITRTGGLSNYIYLLNIRVISFAGLGAFFTITRMINVIDLFYFSINLLYLKKSDNWVIGWLLWLLHSAVFVQIGLLSGSRGFLHTIIFLLVIYHYIKKRFNLTKVLLFGIVILLLAVTIGTAREGYRYDDFGIKTGFDNINSDLSTNWLGRKILHIGKTGILPLEIVLSRPDSNLAHGGTLLAGVTHLIPGNWWQEKPASGGVVLTRDWFYDAWKGYSNLSTGIVAEGVINFGKLAGIVFGLFFLMCVCLCIQHWYNNNLFYLYRFTEFKKILTLIVYVYLWGSCLALPVLEFAAFLSHLIINIVTSCLIYYLLKLICNKHVI